MGKPKARPATKQAGTWKKAATRPGSNSTGRPSSTEAAAGTTSRGSFRAARTSRLIAAGPGPKAAPRESGTKPIKGSISSICIAAATPSSCSVADNTGGTSPGRICRSWKSGPCPASGSLAEKSPPETGGERDQDQQAEEETMAELMAGATALLEPPLPSSTPTPPTRLGCSFRQGIAADTPTALVTVWSTRRAEELETLGDGAPAVAVERGSAVAATASVEVVGEDAAAVEVPTEAVTALGGAGGIAAAFGGGSTSPSANHQGAQQQTLELGPVVDLELSGAAALSASPAPVPTAVLAAAMTAETAAGNQADAPVEGGVSVATGNAGTSAAAEDGDTQERVQAASGRQGHGTRDRHTHHGSRREERHRPDEGGGTTRADPGREHRPVGPVAEDAEQEVGDGEGAQSSAEERRL
ncbi:unnamed protein product [Closterium sp. NIES-65]|nr:unnamed protein product [Closterium sp. NIES-65]